MERGDVVVSLGTPGNKHHKEALVCNAKDVRLTEGGILVVEHEEDGLAQTTAFAAGVWTAVQWCHD